MKTVFESDFSKPDPRWKVRHTPTPDLPAGEWVPKYTRAGRLKMRLGRRMGTVHTTHMSVLDQPFVFGRFEARMKFGGPKGAHACFWLQDVTPNHLGGSEVDIAENFGSENTVWHNVYWRTPDTMWPKEPARWRDYTKGSVHDWRVYGCEWSREGYIFTIDGAAVSTTSAGASSTPKVMILSYLSSKWEWPRLQTDNLKAYRTMVDWVRVKQ